MFDWDSCPRGPIYDTPMSPEEAARIDRQRAAIRAAEKQAAAMQPVALDVSGCGAAYVGLYPTVSIPRGGDSAAAVWSAFLSWNAEAAAEAATSGVGEYIGTFPGPDVPSVRALHAQVEDYLANCE